MLKTQHIAIIGAGRVGTYLHNQLKNKGVSVTLFSRSVQPHAQLLANFKQAYRQFTMVLLCVGDDAIYAASENIPEHDFLVLHVSGASPLEAIHQKHKRKGVFYPLMSITKNSTTALSEIPFCIEAASDADYELLMNFTALLNVSHYLVSSNQRQYLHLAAVFAHNFSNFMYTQAQAILLDQELDFKILIPLLQQHLGKLGAQKAVELQTGPAVRNDAETIKRHLNLIDKPEQAELYKTLTQLIQKQHGA